MGISYALKTNEIVFNRRHAAWAISACMFENTDSDNSEGKGGGGGATESALYL